MASNPLQSAWRRFVQKSGVAFFWAFLFGLVFGAATYFRVERAEQRGDTPWHVTVRLWLDRLEWWTLDWRARELGAASDRADEVVVVAVDEETVANARESDRAAWATRPWPRQLLGEVLEQAVREGAALVLVDQPLADVSPHQCSPCRGDSRKSDDELFAASLERIAGKAVLGYEWQAARQRPGDRALTPVLVKVGDFESEAAALDAVRQVLSLRTTAWLVPEGERRVLWAGAATDTKAREVAAALELKNLTTRGLLPSDDAHEVDRAWLVRRLGSVRVGGVDAERLLQARAIEPPVAEVLLAGTPPGAATLVPDPDGHVRAVPLLISAAGEEGATQVLATVPLRALMLLSGHQDLRYEAGVLRLGDRYAIPMDAEGFHAVRWDADEVGRGGRGTLKRVIPAWRLLVNRDDDQAGRGVRHYDNDLQGRIVVFTDDRAGTRPVRTAIGGLSRAAVFGQTLVDLLHGRGVARTSPSLDFWLTAAFAVMGAVLAMAWSTVVRRPGWLAWVLTLAGVVLLHSMVARQLYVQQQRWVAMAAPLLACCLAFLASLGYARAFEQGLREFVLRALGGAVRADVFHRVERDLLLMRPERRELTVSLCGIEGFTAVAQKEDPRQVVVGLQRYLTEMTNVVLDRQGHVDKYLGDGLMAFWGAPVETADQTSLACDAALEIQGHFEALREDWEKKFGRTLAVRTGIERGATLVGEMGTFHRVNYTVMGEPVATAFRLQQLAKRYGIAALVGPSVPAAAGDRFVFRSVDIVRLRRRPEPARVYELLGRREALGDRLEAVDRWERAMTAYRERRFAEAKELFTPAEGAAADPLALRYLARCDALAVSPPPEGWDGVCPPEIEPPAA